MYHPILAVLLLAASSPIDASPISWVRGLLASRQAPKYTPGTDCCEALKAKFGLKVTSRSSSGYFASLYTYWSLQESEMSPACLVAPSDEADVSEIVQMLSGITPGQTLQTQTQSQTVNGTFAPARPAGSLNCQFAIRGGGHTPWAGAANIQDGVTIDLGNLKNVSVSGDNATVSVGGGAAWGDVYRVLDPLGLAVPGGRVATVGVGGLTLGGGFSFFAPRYGFVCDNVVNYQIVSSGGQIMEVNATSNSGMFRALKGGSNNLGVVTRFDLRAFPQGDHWGGQVFYPDISVAPQILKAFETLNSDNYDEYASLITTFAYVPQFKIWLAINNFQYTQTITDPPQFNVTQGPEVFQPMLNIQPQLPTNATLRVSNMTSFTTELAMSQPLSKRELFATTTIGNNADLMAQIFAIGNSTRESIANTTTQGFFVTFQPIPKLVVQRSQAAANNSLGLNPADGNQVLVLLIITWSGNGEDKQIDAAAKDFIKKSNDAAAKVNLAKPFVYLNYASPWQNPLKSYNTDNLNNIKNASVTADPFGTFQNNVPGGFKLATAA